MSTIDERKDILRGTSLFSDIPDELLCEVADHLKVVAFKAGDAVFQKGDQSDCMYVIQEGRLRVHDGQLTFNMLEKGDVVGEMAALDPDVRSASVTAETEAVLFQLEQREMLALMAREFKAVQGIIHVLCQHLRRRLGDMDRDFQYIQQVNLVAQAARAVETGNYQPDLLDLITLRDDELGQLARVFQRMANEVYQREMRYKQSLQELQIQLDEARQQEQVAEITESEYFQKLLGQADHLRGIMGG